MRRGVLAAAVCAMAAAPAVAADCRLALLLALDVSSSVDAQEDALQRGGLAAALLALDVSSSVDAQEDALQRGGLAAALLAPEVQAAFFATDLPVALAAYEWSGRYNQEVVLDWVLIDSAAAIRFASERIASSRRSHNEFPTAMGYALGYGALMLQRGPACLTKTIDVAGDGRNNEGFPPATAYAEFPFDGVTVNGLAVNAAEFEAETELIFYYRYEVLRGPGAFLEVAEGFEDYERAMRRKLERELRPPAIGALGTENGRAPG